MTSVRPALDRGFKEELRAERRNNRAEGRSETGSEQRSERLARRDRRRSERENGGGSEGAPGSTTTPPSGTQGTDLVTIQPVPNPTTAPPTTTPPASTNPTDDSVKSLAAKYVDIYTQQSGRTISASTRDALVNDVASFYGENGGRTDRLRSLVGVF